MNRINEVYMFYRNGFKSMIVGKTLWKIILVKLFVLFFIFKMFFFQDYLGSKFETDVERADYVLDQLTHVN